MARRAAQAILFDMDGTLLDSRQAVIPAFEYALQQHGVPVPPVAELLPYSHSLRALQETIAPQVPYDDLLASYDERLEELLHTIVPYDNVAKVLQELKQHCKLGVVSSARRAPQAVKRYGVEAFFDTVVGGLDVLPHKPHPAPVLLALERLDVEPEHAVMVGDLPADILAAKAAVLGLSVGVTHGFGTRELLEHAGADYIIDSLNELPDIVAKF